MVEACAAAIIGVIPRSVPARMRTLFAAARGADPLARPDLGMATDNSLLIALALPVATRRPSSAAELSDTLFLVPSGRTTGSTKIAARAAPTDPTLNSVRVRLTVPTGAAIDALRMRLLSGVSRR